MNEPAKVSFRKVLGRILGVLIVVAAAGAVLAVGGRYSIIRRRTMPRCLPT